MSGEFGKVEEIDVPDVKIENPCICIGYPDCPHMDDYKDSKGNLKYKSYKNERTPIKICNDKEDPKFCIKNPIPQPKERLHTLKIMYKEAKIHPDKQVSISPYPYNNSPAFIFIETVVDSASKKRVVRNKVMINRSDAQAIVDSDK